MTRRVVFGSPFIGEEERREVLDCLDSGWLGTGPRVARFEEQFRRYLGAEAVVAVSSGSAALHLALLALELPAGSEVITTPLTFCATANAIIHAGLVPVFADVDPVTLNLDPAEVERRITSRTSAILPVHLGGRACDMRALMDLASRRRLRIVEDCAHAIEARVEGKPCGTFGDFGCFSFYVTKNVTTVEGGMVVCRDAETARRLRVLSHHGMNRDAWQRHDAPVLAPYDVAAPGFKYNLTDLAASIGVHQLARIEETFAWRKKLWARYRRELAELPLVLPADEVNGEVHARHLFSCLLDEERAKLSRDELRHRLAEEGIGTGIHYPPVHLLTWYRQSFGYREGSFPVAESAGRRTFSIPFSAAVTEDDATAAVAALRKVLA